MRRSGTKRFEASDHEMVSVDEWTPTIGDVLGRETCTFISYLLGSDFLCLTVGSPLYYRTSINKRKRKELSMNTCKSRPVGVNIKT